MSNVTIALSDQEEQIIRQYATEANLSIEDVIGETIRQSVSRLQLLISNPLADSEPQRYSHPDGQFYDVAACASAVNLAMEQLGQSQSYDTDADSDLEEEIAVYQNKQQELLEKYPDQYVLIKGPYLVATFPDQYDALEFGLSHFGNVTFLVKQLTTEEKLVIVA